LENAEYSMYLRVTKLKTDVCKRKKVLSRKASDSLNYEAGQPEE
jgi:hypothetical protein